MPESVDTEKMNATYNNGVLSIDIPKREEAKAKPIKNIKIS
jgi:HSP20 family protein